MTIRTVAAGCFVMIFGAGALTAQSLSDVDEPAEYPPASFKESQYVDSRGCAFIRAGVDGNVVWVPRVARDRSLLCGLEPSLAQAPAAVVEAKPQADVQAAPAATSAPAATPEATNLETAPATPEPMPSPAMTPAPNPLAKAAVPAARPKAKPVKRQRRAAVLQPKDAGPMLPPVPPQTACQGGNRVSQGYVGNPNRDFPVRCGPQKELPYYPGATAIEAQPAPKKRAAFQPQVRQQDRLQKRGGTLVTKGQYVQVGTFTVAENADKTAARMRALGLPALVGQYTRGGIVYRIVLAGPFGAGAERAAALGKVRGAGFGDAFVR